MYLIFDSVNNLDEFQVKGKESIEVTNLFNHFKGVW